MDAMAALADPIRWSIIDEPEDVGTLAVRFPACRTAVSHHPRVHRDSGLARSETAAHRRIDHIELAFGPGNVVTGRITSWSPPAEAYPTRSASAHPLVARLPRQV